MKTAIIVHGMPSKEEYHDISTSVASISHWLVWLQKQLLNRDILAQVPAMPAPYIPEYQAWKQMLDRFPINQETILVGHSCGAGFIVRYLSESNVKVGKVVLVAPWIDPSKSLETKMFDFDIDENLANKTKGLIVFSSTNDNKEIQKSVDMLKNKIKNLKVVEFKDYGHFCYDDMKTDQFPELLKELI